VAASAATLPILQAKREWIGRNGATRAERVARFQHIRDLNARLMAFVLPERQGVEAEHREELRRVELDAVAGRRDYAFCLYPEALLRDFFGRAL
jgi:hypothetical protein